MEYTPDGNIVRKGDAGEMVYTNPNRPYAVTGNTPEKEACIHSGLQVGYTAADRPAWIEEGNRKAEFTYNAQFDRVRMRMAEEGKTVYTRYYLGGNYEAHCDSSGTEERLYVGGDCYEAPALLVRKEGKTEIRFLHRDYLGSILQVADNKGNIIEENSFDAWGSRRDPDTQEIYTGTEAPSLMTGRGFTGHEHLDGFGLIHMNARLYDPILGRFLSPAPYVQLPDFTQAMNRYGYCMNRPLCYVDKNGEIIGWIIAGALIGGAINVATHWDNISNFGQFLGYFGVGAAAGALGPLVGGAVGGAGFIGGAISGMVGGAASGFTLGTGNTLMAGGGFLNALGNGTMGAFSGAICGGALGGVIGGGTAIAKGQNFWHGNTIAQGRGMFSWKNTPVGETGALNSVPDVIAETPNDVSTYQSTSKVVYDESSNSEILIHYTTENGYKSIMESKQLLPSVGIKHARYGDGQYFTDLNSIDYTVGQLSRRLYRVPWNKSHLTHFIKIDVSGLNIIKNGPHNFLLPNNQPLNLNNRIVGGGVSIFKIKF